MARDSARIPATTRASTKRPSATGGTKRPFHIGVAIGASAGVYAASLAFVTLAQIETDRVLAADRRPVADAIEALRDHHDGMETSLDAARAVYAEATTRYGVVVKRAGALHAAVDRLGRQVAEIEGARVSAGSGSSSALPAAPGKPTAAKSSGGGSAVSPPSNGSSGASGRP